MQPILPATGIFFLFVVGRLLTTGNTQGDQTWYKAKEKTYGDANCNFEHRQCGWSHWGEMAVRWQREGSFLNYYMSAKMTGARINSTARLASPWFKPTLNQQCTLRFRYYFGQDDNCQLSVVLQTNTTSTEVWSTRKSTGKILRWLRSPITIPSSNCRHRILFEARKLRGGHCGYKVGRNSRVTFHDQVDIDDIKFSCFNMSHGTTATSSQQSSTLANTPRGTSNRGKTTTEFSTQDTDATDVSTATLPTSASPSPGPLHEGTKSADTGGKRKGRTIGLTVGIVLAVVVVVAVVWVFMFCHNNTCGDIRGGKSVGKDPKSQTPSSQREWNGTGDRTNTGTTHANPAFSSDDGATSVYVIASDPDYLYSVPDKIRRGKKGTSNPARPKKNGGAASTEQDDNNTMSLNRSGLQGTRIQRSSGRIEEVYENTKF